MHAAAATYERKSFNCLWFSITVLETIKSHGDDRIMQRPGIDWAGSFTKILSDDTTPVTDEVKEAFTRNRKASFAKTLPSQGEAHSGPFHAVSLFLYDPALFAEFMR